MEDASHGAAALAVSKYPEAIAHYTNAIAANPAAVDYYIKRSTAYQRCSPPDHAAALKDAEIAVILARNRGRRELIAEAQLRRAIAFFSLEQYGNAQFCAQIAKTFAPKERAPAMWEAKINVKLKALPEDHEARKVTVQEIPKVEVSAVESAKKVEKPASVQATTDPVQPDVKNVSPKPTAEEKQKKDTTLQTPQQNLKVRHEWYQSSDNVVITLFAKGVSKDKTSVDIQERSVSCRFQSGSLHPKAGNKLTPQATISFPLPSSSDFHFTLDPLYAAIDPASSSFNVMSTKIEIVLKKATPGERWPSLESAATGPVTRTVASGSSTNQAPIYPTSSRKGPKDWDKIASELTTRPKKRGPPGSESSSNGGGRNETIYIGGGSDGAADAKPQVDPEPELGADDEDGDEEGGDQVNAFFKKLYASADPDTRRAMVKSYQESNGTALSTNWKEVSKGPVETSPPDGMVARKWDS